MSSTKPEEEQVRALIVDDDELVRETYAEVLRSRGFDVDAVGEAVQALQQLSFRPYEVVISDIQMPGIDGLELLKAVRRVDLDVPIILMTGAPSIDTAIEAIEHGAFRYLRKPVTVDLLEETVKRATRYHRLNRLRRDAIGLTGGVALWPADRAAMESRFESALSKLWVALQPIVSIRGRQVFAYESLMRSDEKSLAGPRELLEAAEALGRIPDLGRAVRRSVASLLKDVPRDIRAFVNLHPLELSDPHLLDQDAPLAADSSRVVFEVTERASLHHIHGLQERARQVRAMGYGLAVDDLGAGYAGLSSMAQLEPEFVKLDMSLVRGIHRSVTQQRLVRSMVEVCQDLGKDVIAEGVEEEAERDELVNSGCDLLQGYLFGRPTRGVPATSPGVALV
jgi:EAL domain-containing protein (putative c-di-GMP-specific phosphodiesterase class I)